MLIIFKPYEDTSFTCHSHECVRVIDLPEFQGELLISVPVEGTNTIETREERHARYDRERENDEQDLMHP
jgi:hypothetical protein